MSETSSGWTPDGRVKTGERRTPNWGRIAMVAVPILAILIGLLSWFVTTQSVISEGNKHQNTLNASYSNGANYLSDCTRKASAASQVAVANKDALVEIYREAIGGRYKSGGAAVDTGKFFSAVTEAYPDLTPTTALFKDALAIITGCQDDFTRKQNVILDQVRAFEDWRTGSWRVRTFGGENYPTDGLRVSIPGVEPVTGVLALNKMREPLVTGSTSESYQDGTIEDAPLFPQPAPAVPTPR